MNLSDVLYTAEQIRQGELLAARAKNITMYELMKRAGKAVFCLLREQYPNARHILVCCGGGNNGGDGYIVAKLAKSAGLKVTLWQLGDERQLTGDAQTAKDEWLNFNGSIAQPVRYVSNTVDIIIDAILGTGLNGEVRLEAKTLINKLNQSNIPILSIDIPSGLSANTGLVIGSSIMATHTLTFIGIKRGLVTGSSRDYIGQLHFAGLGVDDVFKKQNPPFARIINNQCIEQYLKARKKTSHKGDYGKALCLGGNSGMGGAILLCAEACARVGAGLTTVLTHPDHTSSLLAACPEIMTSAWNGTIKQIQDKLDRASVFAIGPGLGRDKWAMTLFENVSKSIFNKILDADAINLLAQKPNQDKNRIITPHPAEAARLLNCSVADIEADRYQTVKNLYRRYDGVVVLKGAGTLVYGGKDIWVCLAGNPGMATGGMGDVLTGVILGLLAQRIPLEEAAKLGVLIHSLAADQCAKLEGERGLLAHDLFPYLRKLVNLRPLQKTF